MIEINYQYPGDPLLPARLMFGAEFKEERGPGQIRDPRHRQQGGGDRDD